MKRSFRYRNKLLNSGWPLFATVLLLPSAPAAGNEKGISLAWTGLAARLAQADSQIIFGSALGLRAAYAQRLSQSFRLELSYGAQINASSLLLHGPGAMGKFTIFGGSSRTLGDATFFYRLHRPFEISVPLGVQLQFYDVRSVVQVDGIRRKDSTRLEGSAYSGATGLELGIPLQNDMYFHTLLQLSLGRTIESVGDLLQVQLNAGVEKKL